MNEFARGEYPNDHAAFRLYRMVERIPPWRFWLTEREKQEARAMLVRYSVRAEVERIATMDQEER